MPQYDTSIPPLHLRGLSASSLNRTGAPFYFDSILSTAKLNSRVASHAYRQPVIPPGQGHRFHAHYNAPGSTPACPPGPLSQPVKVKFTGHVLPSGTFRTLV